MNATKRLDLALVWHMHQPDYRDPESGEFLFPWVYLHAIKDYADMAWHLEHRPHVRATVNLVPVLLDQIEAYARGFQQGEVPDPLLRLLAHPDPDRVTADERRLILDSCFRSNHTRMIEPFPAYRFLLDLFRRADEQGEAGRSYLSGQYLADLLTWYHLAWTGETVRREHALVVDLMTKGSCFTLDERRRLYALIGGLLADMVPRYRALAQSGRIELTTTPHEHPLAPLIIDLTAARDALPELPLPKESVYPGGRTRVAAHVSAAMDAHARRFGARPTGIWPAEGAVSMPVLNLLAEGGCRWAASSEAVLVSSLAACGRKAVEKAQFLYRPYQACGVALLFRDDRLSDLIGFEYAKWHGKDAATHFVAQLEAVAAAAPAGSTPLVSVILDGENAWEYYPYNGYYFLQDLYALLEAHPTIATVTPARWLAEHPDVPRERLERVAAGSWVYGNLSTWIGSPDKNRAWDLLCAAKRSYDLVVASGRLGAEELAVAGRRLAVCEASDWFWWFGDYNPARAVASFDRLYRRNLECLYRALHLEPPADLAEPISHGGGQPEAGGAMRRST